MLTEALAYRLLLLLSAFGSLLVAARVWRRRSAPASRSLAVFLAAVAEWALAVLLADLTIDTDAKLLLNTASYIGIAMIPVAWVGAALYSYLLLAVGVGVRTRTILGSSAASLKQATAYGFVGSFRSPTRSDP